MQRNGLAKSKVDSKNIIGMARHLSLFQFGTKRDVSRWPMEVQVVLRMAGRLSVGRRPGGGPPLQLLSCESNTVKPLQRLKVAKWDGKESHVTLIARYPSL